MSVGSLTSVTRRNVVDPRMCTEDIQRRRDGEAQQGNPNELCSKLRRIQTVHAQNLNRRKQSLNNLTALKTKKGSRWPKQQQRLVQSRKHSSNWRLSATDQLGSACCKGCDTAETDQKIYLARPPAGRERGVSWESWTRKPPLLPLVESRWTTGQKTCIKFWKLIFQESLAQAIEIGVSKMHASKMIPMVM